MSQIIVKKNSSLKKPEIIVPITNASVTETGEENYVSNKQQVQQTLIHGIQAPLIRVNNIVINFEEILSFSLKSIDRLPTVNMVIGNRHDFLSTLDGPRLDNELVVQILPQFDKIYKKINLVFYITNVKNLGSTISITGTYKLPKLLSSNIKSFGNIGTYKLFEDISNETKLGFATNINKSEQDKRYVYCDYKSYKDVLDREIACGGTKDQVLDYWVDWWDNINLVDIKERYKTIDQDKDMQIWISVQKDIVEENSKIEPVKALALLTNNQSFKASELYVPNYNIINNTGGQVFSGTDKLYSTYEIEKEEYVDYLIQDGDVKKDIYTKFEYMGEVYGGYNYLLSSRKRAAFLQKMNTEVIEVSLGTPLLGLMRGHKVNFVWYDDDSLEDYKKEEMKKHNLLDTASKTNIPIDSGSYNEKDTGFGKFDMDKSISGQYLIIGCNMKFENSKWNYVLRLARPADQKPNILIENKSK